jgi:hypothetical protein
MLYLGKSCTVEFRGSDIDAIASEEVSWTFTTSGS